MQFMTTHDIRQAFLKYFIDRGHHEVASSPLVPNNDPTLLFVNAGMVQFKDTFLGSETRSYARASSSQRCMRAGGKHNDLEQVGYTKRHHTFFEMLGNFSFGDYFKQEAIDFAWRFLTEVLAIDPKRLWVTVYKDDAESEAIWLETMGFDPDRFTRCGDKDNFWSMGDTGPCGPCTEIFYDHGDSVAGGPPGSADEEGDRYVEIWNLVFMQYNRDSRGDLSPLPKPCVDTGMGLERVACVMQGVHDNYDIDLFMHLLKAISELSGCEDFTQQSMRVVADHIRACAFLIADGVSPSNEGRGYVLRRIIRRAIRHGHKLGITEVFFYQLVEPLIEIMGQAYPTLQQHQTLIENLLEQEEKLFYKTLDNGVKVLNEKIKNLQGKIIPGDTVFMLYDTYGFPPDLTADIAREKSLLIDEAGFEQAMSKQRRQSQAANQFMPDQVKQLTVNQKTEFCGYDRSLDEVAVSALIGADYLPVKELAEGEAGIIILDQTPFYAESGGQVGDRGIISNPDFYFEVTDSQQHSHAVLHFGTVIKGHIALKVKAVAEVSTEREATQRNHSATHLLHSALREVLGDHVQQKGSLVDAAHLRFDFSHSQALTKEQLRHIESLVYAQILDNHALHTELQSLDEAKATGAMALFGEKYADQVRVVSMGPFSKEICGGTHVERTGDIGLFKITAESACSAGVRRIEAVTGLKALEYAQQQASSIRELASLLNAKPSDIVSKVKVQQDEAKNLNKELTQLKQRMSQQQGLNMLDNAKTVGDVKVLAVNLEKSDRDSMRHSLDQMIAKLGKAAVVLATVEGEKITLVAGVSENCLPKFKAPDLLKYVATQVGGKGGGRPLFAQGGGSEPKKLQAALDSVADWVSGQL